MKIKLVIIALFYFFDLSAQDTSCLKMFESKTIRQEGNSFIINDKTVQFSEVKLLLQNSDVSKNDFLIYKKARSKSKILLISSTVLVGSAILLRNSNKKLAIGLAIGGLVSQYISIPITLGSKKHLDRSIYGYNKSVF